MSRATDRTIVIVGSLLCRNRLTQIEELDLLDSSGGCDRSISSDADARWSDREPEILTR